MKTFLLDDVNRKTEPVAQVHVINSPERYFPVASAGQVALHAIMSNEATLWRTPDGLYTVYDDPLWSDPTDTLLLAYDSTLGLVRSDAPGLEACRFLIARIEDWLKRLTAFGLHGIRSYGEPFEPAFSRANAYLNALPADRVERVVALRNALDTASPADLQAVAAELLAFRAALPQQPSDDELYSETP